MLGLLSSARYCEEQLILLSKELASYTITSNTIAIITLFVPFVVVVGSWVLLVRKYHRSIVSNGPHEEAWFILAALHTVCTLMLSLVFFIEGSEALDKIIKAKQAPRALTLEYLAKTVRGK